MTKYITKGDKIADHNITSGRVGICPHCEAKLVVRKGKYGLFVSCKNYNCNTTYNYKSFRIFDDDSIDLLNLELSEEELDIRKASEIRDTCSENIRGFVNWKCHSINEAIEHKLCH